MPWWAALLLLTGVCGLLISYFLYTEWQILEGRLGVPLDDAWIHFTFARNLVSGEGFSIVPGEPTPGSTAPLWTIVMSGIGLLTTNFVTPALMVSGAFFIITVWLTFGLALELTKNWPTALLAALATALSGRLVWAGLSAMEVTLFTALTLGAVWLYQRRGLDWLTAILLGIASQARPEGHFLFLLLVADSLISYRFPPHASAPKPGWRSLLGAILVYGVINMPYTFFAYSVTGRPLPNTFFAKADAEQLFSWRTLRETLQLLWQDNQLAFLLVPFGVLFLWRRSRVFVGWLIGLLVLSAFILPFVWHYGRYTMPLIPFQMIAGASGLYWVCTKLPANRTAVATVGSVAILLAGIVSIPGWADKLGANTREIIEIDVAMAQWLAENIAPDVTIAVDDIGAIGFFAPQPILDLHGLISPEIWSTLTDSDTISAQVRLMAQSGVKYMAVFPGWHQPVTENSEVAKSVQRFTTESHTIIGEPNAVVYEMNWPYDTDSLPQNERLVILSGIIKLRGYDIVYPLGGQPLRLTLYWESLADVDENYKVFIHIIDDMGAIIAQVDNLPTAGLAPTTRWQKGDLIRDPYLINLPAELTSGNYQIRAGLYTDEFGRLTAAGENVQDNAIFLTEWRIE
jgi:hypothetical protein